MGFVLIGVLFIVLRVGGWVQFHPDDFWAWVIVLSPFALAVVWWGWSDATGLTKRKAMQVLDEKKEARRAQLMEGLGQSRPGDKKRR
jgi:small Trp-rich protein